jgi:hypothetical protein
MSTYVGVDSDTSTVAVINSLNIPAAAQVGDVAWLIWSGGNTVTYTDPTGWTLMETQAYNAGITKRYTRVIQSGDPGSAVSPTTSASQRQCASIIVFRGVDTTTPETQNVETLTNNTPSATRTNPAITTGETASLISYVADRGATSGTWTQPASWTQVVNVNTTTSGSVSQSVAYRANLAAGTYGSDVWTSTEALQAQAVACIVQVNDETVSNPPPNATATDTSAVVIDATGSTAGAGTLSYGIARISGEVATATSITSGKWWVPRPTSGTTVWRVTVTQTDTQTDTFDVNVTAAAGTSDDAVEIKYFNGTVWA